MGPWLPFDFEWGFATAAYQIEGAANEGGRGKSIWDTFCHLQPSRTNGSNGDVACDHYHQFKEDLDLLSQYGAKSYRFSVSWSRVIPLGGRNDPVNEDGLAFYDNLIDDLVRRGITPWVTLYHWDLPQALHDRYGGWLNLEESQQDFERYARACFTRFGDRVKHWITINEPWVVAVSGYATGINAPGRSSINPMAPQGNTATEPWMVGKSLIMSHARAVNLYNEEFRPFQNGIIGISLNGDYFEPWSSDSFLDKASAERRMDFQIGWFADPIYLATDYPSCMRQQLSDRLPHFSDEEYSILQGAIPDFYGMNYYTAKFARHIALPPLEIDFIGNVDELVDNHDGISIGQSSGVDWLQVCPEQFRKHMLRIQKRYKKPIYITENGCPCPGEDKMSREEAVMDSFRSKYLEAHLDQMKRAIVEDHCQIKGYFAWSLLDNLEWSDGFGVRFGVTHVDYKTLKRTPKQSALLLKGFFGSADE